MTLEFEKIYNLGIVLLVMKKKGGVLLVIGIILLVIILVVAGGGFYFYNFYVFKTVRICVTNEVNDTPIICSSDDFCIEKFRSSSELPDLSSFPSLISDKIFEAFDVAVFCEETCKVRRIRGFGDGENIEEIESCSEGDEEIKLEIRGKEGVALLKFLEENEDLRS